MPLCGPGFGCLPAFMVVFVAITIATSYMIAVFKGDVRPDFPYISDTGTVTPESNIFGQLLNLAAFLAFINMYLRYKMVCCLVEDQDRHLRIVNSIGLWLAFITSLGLSLVANFQESAVLPVHVLGASLAFAVGTLYTFVQTYITYKMYPLYNGLRIARIRLFFSVLSLVFMLMTMVGAGIAKRQWDAVNSHPHSKLKWCPDDPGYTLHVVSAASEWALTASFMAYFLTFIRDFQKVTFEVHTQLFVTHLDQVPFHVAQQAPFEPNERTRLLRA